MSEKIKVDINSSIGFDKIEDDVFRKLVVARLSCPSSKSATVEYLKNHFDLAYCIHEGTSTRGTP